MTKKKGNKKDLSNLLQLVMIVRNASSVIATTLKAIKPFIDRYTILDTGSTDNTISIIQDVMADVKGGIHQEPFIDFATSRNRALEIAGDVCIYTLFLDDSYIIQGGEKLRSLLKTKKDLKNIDIRIYNPDDKKIYYSTRILSSKAQIRYQYRVHEVPNIKEPSYIITDPDIYIKDCNTVFTLQRSKARFEKDLEGLYLDAQQYPNDTRVMYYLGMTNLMISRYSEAKKWLELCISKKQKPDEYLYQARYNLGLVLFKLRSDWKNVEEQLKHAIKLYPNRAEPYYKIAAQYYKQGELQTAYLILKDIINFPIPTNFLLDVETDIYKVKIPYLYVDTCMILSQHGIKIDIKSISKLLKKCIVENPTNYQFVNIKEMIEPSNPSKNISCMQKSNIKTIVFYTSFIQGQIWNPKDFENSYVSGSEIMVKNLSIEIAKLNYKVVVFGSFANSTTNFECNYQSVEFIDNSKYYEWIKCNYVDYLIVSRIPTSILYLPNIQRVYLWMHDIYPDYEYIQAHETKFAGVLALCEWHKDILQEEFNIPLNMIQVTRNAIYTERFINRNIEKIPNRFIWTSHPYRGLKYLLNMFPKIREHITDATLYIFVNRDFLSEQEINIINNSDFIFLENRKSQEEISIEFLKSDIWMYPTDFEETYCITALEAQAAGCLCVTNNIGSLSEIVGDRGIVIDGDIRDTKIQDKMIEECVKTIKTIKTEEKINLVDKAQKWAHRQTYYELAKEWCKKIIL